MSCSMVRDGPLIPARTRRHLRPAQAMLRQQGEGPTGNRPLAVREPRRTAAVRVFALHSSHITNAHARARRTQPRRALRSTCGRRRVPATRDAPVRERPIRDEASSCRHAHRADDGIPARRPAAIRTVAGDHHHASSTQICNTSSTIRASCPRCSRARPRRPDRELRARRGSRGCPVREAWTGSRPHRS